MPNMSYCRFENTAKDLEDCLEHLEDDLGDTEEEAREKLIELCENILKDSGRLDDLIDDELND